MWSFQVSVGVTKNYCPSSDTADLLHAICSHPVTILLLPTLNVFGDSYQYISFHEWRDVKIFLNNSPFGLTLTLGDVFTLPA